MSLFVSAFVTTLPPAVVPTPTTLPVSPVTTQRFSSTLGTFPITAVFPSSSYASSSTSVATTIPATLSSVTLSSSALPPPNTIAPASTSPNTGLSSGAIAGISIGAILGVLLIAVAAFLLGRRSSTHQSSASDLVVTERDVPIGGYKAESDGQGRATVEREGRGIARWWSKKFSKSVKTRALDEAEPRDFSAEEAKGEGRVRQVRVRDEDLPEFRGV